MERKRKNPGCDLGCLRPDRKEKRRLEALARAECRATMTPREQLAALDRRLGKGVGANKERAILAT